MKYLSLPLNDKSMKIKKITSTTNSLIEYKDCHMKQLHEVLETELNQIIDQVMKDSLQVLRSIVHKYVVIGGKAISNILLKDNPNFPLSFDYDIVVSKDLHKFAELLTLELRSRSSELFRKMLVNKLKALNLIFEDDDKVAAFYTDETLFGFGQRHRRNNPMTINSHYIRIRLSNIFTKHDGTVVHYTNSLPITEDRLITEILLPITDLHFDGFGDSLTVWNHPNPNIVVVEDYRYGISYANVYMVLYNLLVLSNQGYKQKKYFKKIRYLFTSMFKCDYFNVSEDIRKQMLLNLLQAMKSKDRIFRKDLWISNNINLKGKTIVDILYLYYHNNASLYNTIKANCDASNIFNKVYAISDSLEYTLSKIALQSDLERYVFAYTSDSNDLYKVVAKYLHHVNHSFDFSSEEMNFYTDNQTVKTIFGDVTIPSISLGSSTNPYSGYVDLLKRFDTSIALFHTNLQPYLDDLPDQLTTLCFKDIYLLSELITNRSIGGGDLRVGDIIRYPSYCSVSYTAGWHLMPHIKSNKVVLQIQIPKAKPCWFFVGSYSKFIEKEILIDKNQIMVVTNISWRVVRTLHHNVEYKVISLQIIDDTTESIKQAHYQTLNYSLPLLSPIVVHAASYLYRTRFSKPYTETHLCDGGVEFADDVAITLLNGTVPRNNHGLAHSIRVAGLIILYYGILCNSRLPVVHLYDTRKLIFIIILGIFSVSGRESEASFNTHEDCKLSEDKDNPYQRYLIASANNFKTFMEYMKTTQNTIIFTNEEIEEGCDIIINYYYITTTSPRIEEGDLSHWSSKQMIAHMLHVTHSLDLVRCKTSLSINAFGFQDYLISLSTQLCKLTGDRIMLHSQEQDYHNKFYQYSHYPNFCLQQVNNHILEFQINIPYLLDITTPLYAPGDIPRDPTEHTPGNYPTEHTPGNYPTGPPGNYPIAPPGNYPTGPPGNYPTGHPGNYPIGPPGNYPIGPPGNYPTERLKNTNIGPSVDESVYPQKCDPDAQFIKQHISDSLDDYLTLKLDRTPKSILIQYQYKVQAMTDINLFHFHTHLLEKNTELQQNYKLILFDNLSDDEIYETVSRFKTSRKPIEYIPQLPPIDFRKYVTKPSDLPEFATGAGEHSYYQYYMSAKRKYIG